VSERSIKIKVGLLSLFGLLCLVGFVMILGTFGMGERRSYFIELSDSGSLLPGAPVKIAGVRAGRVEEAIFLVARDARRSAARVGETQPINVRLRISVDLEKAPAIRQDSEFFVTSQGVLGERYLEIAPGTASAPEWAEGAYIRGEDPPRLDLLMARADHILQQIDTFLGGESEELNLAKLTGAITRLSLRLDRFFEEHEERIKRLLIRAESSLTELEALASMLRAGLPEPERLENTFGYLERASRRLARELPPSFSQAKRSMKRAEETLVLLESILEESRAPLKAGLKELPSIATQTQALSRDAARLAARLKAGKGSAGRFLRDTEIYEDFKEFLRALKRDPWKLFWRE